MLIKTREELFMKKNTAYAALNFAISTNTGQEQHIAEAIRNMSEISVSKVDRELVTLRVLGQAVSWEPESEIDNRTFGTVTFFVSHEFECESWELEMAAQYYFNDLNIQDELYLAYPDGMPLVVDTHNIEIEWNTKPIIRIA